MLVCALCGGAHRVRLADLEPVGGGGARRPGRGRAPGLVGQPLHARLRHVPAARRRIGGGHRRHGGRDGRHADRDRRGRDPAEHRQLRADLHDRGLRLPGRARSSSTCWRRRSSRRASAKRTRHEAVHPRRLPARERRSRPSSTTASRRRCRSSTTTATCRSTRSRATIASARSPRSGWTATTTSGGPCARTACPSAAAPATRRTGRSSRPGRARCPRRCATRSTTGRTWSCGARSASTRCSAPTTARDDLRALQRAAGASPASPRWACCEPFRVAVVCTTDDPVDSLAAPRRAGRAASDPVTRVYPDLAARPGARRGRPRGVRTPGSTRLEAASRPRRSRASSRSWRRSTRGTQAFHDLGCRASDHGLEPMLRGALRRRRRSRPPSTARARAGARRRRGRASSSRRCCIAWRCMDHARGWVQQFHLGALRNTQHAPAPRRWARTAALDSIGDFEQARPLAPLPGPPRRRRTSSRKTILYNLNPRDNELFATMIGNFQDGSRPGQDAVRRRLVVPRPAGRAWRRSCDALSNMGLLSRFVGMITDSRSFLSYSRHDYFRRLLCNLLGEDVRRGLVPDDRDLLGRLVRRRLLRERARLLRPAARPRPLAPSARRSRVRRKMRASPSNLGDAK